MVSSGTKNDVWQGLLDVVRYYRYYSALASKYRINHLVVRFLLAASAILTVAPIVPSVPDFLSSIGGVAVVGLVVWDLLFDYGKRVAALSVIVAKLGELEIRHRRLWSNTNGNLVSDEEAHKQLDDILGAAGNLVRGSDLAFNARLNERCQEDTYKMEPQRYAPAG